MFDPEIVKGFLQLGGIGVLGVIFFFASRASDKRLDKMMDSMSAERGLWRATIDTLSHNIAENTNQVDKLDCVMPRRRPR